MQLKYQSVFNDLQSKILAGLWPENAKIPTEFELCKAHNVSRITVRRALDELVQLGLIRRLRGRGTFVCSSKHISEFRNGLIDSDEDAIVQNIYNKIIEESAYSADSDLAKSLSFLNRSADDLAQPIVRLRILELVNDLPHSLKSVFITEQTNALIDRQTLTRKPFIEAYESCSNKKVASLHRSVSAVIPDEEACSLLQVKRGTAHLWMKNTAFLEDDTPIAVSYAILNGNLFDFVVNIDLSIN
ncbi:MAG: GntR family transcriptional regulator [Sphaerochaetaceae bacterium]